MTRILIHEGSDFSQSKIKLVLGSRRHGVKCEDTLILTVGHGGYEWRTGGGHCDDSTYSVMSNSDFIAKNYLTQDFSEVNISSLQS